MIIVQGLINVFGLLTGTILIDQGMFVMAFFMSISAGTFFYISLVEVLNEQLKLMSKSKIVALLTAIFFIAFIVWFEKHEEEIAEQSK